jgi:hypothetical protein
MKHERGGYLDELTRHFSLLWLGCDPDFARALAEWVDPPPWRQMLRNIRTSNKIALVSLDFMRIGSQV